ncbi:MAG: glycosyltransferase family 4 protein [Bacteroidetes bacterium]|nr:glycosyltransferase family 4 protein [Bacteroidota bacterium]
MFSEEEKKHINSHVIDFPDFRNLPGHYMRESYEYSNKIFKAFQNNSNIDFVYAKGFTGWKLIEEKKKGFQCAPIGVNFHGYEMFQNAPSFKSKLEQILFLKKPVLYNIRNADYVLSYGGKITEIVSSLVVKKNTIIEIPAAIESDWLIGSIHPAGKKRKFLFIGRYERRKGIEELNQVLKEMIIEYDFEFHFIGQIPENKKIISEKIFYHGIISDSEKIKSITAICDILVCPSFSEGMPNVILEAMACGLAVIATDTGAINLLVSSQTGWLIEPGKMFIKRSMIEAILSSDGLINQKREASVQLISKDFIWDKIIFRTINEIERAAVK